MNMKKLLAFALCMVLVAGLSIAGTIAWLTDTTEEVKNTFSPSGIEISLTETKNVVNGKWNAQLIPGKEYAKDPIVAVEDQTNVDVFLFVKFEETAPDLAATDEAETTKDYLDYTSTLTTENGWKLLKDNIWYREVLADDTVKSWHLLDGDKVTIKDITEAETQVTGLELVYTAYAIQMEGMTDAADAWAKLNP